MLIYLLISISFSIQRFCLCQPDRLANSCSLEKKCHRYFSQSDIIVYNSQTNFGKNLFSSSNSSQKSIKNENNIKNTNFDSILFEVFGSQVGNRKSDPISINMLDEMFSDISKLAIYGGESNQVVYIRNMDSVQISLEAQNIQVIFVNENKISFDKLSLRNSYLKFENSSKLAVEAREVIGDSFSLSSNYFSLIKTGKIQVTDKKDQNLDLSNNFGITAPVEIINFDSKKSTFGKKGAKKIQEDSSSTSQNKFANYYCLATQARLSRAKELLECDAYSVPIQNYYSGRDTDFLNILENAEESTDFRIYITLSTEGDPLRINIPEFKKDKIKISFISASVDSETRMEVKGRTNTSKDLTLIVSKIDYFLIESTYLQSFNNIQLYQSPIYISDARQNTTVQNLMTDATSLSQFTDTDLYINQLLNITRATPVTLLSKVFLAENCTVEVNQYSAFPITRYNYDKDINVYYLTLSDAIEDQRLNLYFNGSIVMNYTEGSSIPTAPSLTFAGGKTIKQEKNEETLQIRSNCPYMNFTISVPEVGLIINYGSGSEREIAFPHTSVFTFKNVSTAATNLNLTISDFSTINNISDNFVLAFVGPFNINVMTPETIPPYLQGVNYRLNGTDCNHLFNDKEDVDLPSFLNASDLKCYQIGGYGLSLINLDVQEKLQSITYNDTAVLVGLIGSDQKEKFPKITKTIEITTSTNDMINFTINSTYTSPDNMAPIQINLKGSPDLFFDETYNSIFNSSYPKYFECNDAMGNLTINHGSNDLLLKGENFPVPLITIDDPIKGVLFESGDAKFSSDPITQDTFTTKNTRYGPIVEVNINSGINYPQDSFLAEEVIFVGTSSPTLHFQYVNPSRVNYTFENINVDFTGTNKTVDFKGKRLGFVNSEIKPKDPLTIIVDELYVNSITSILESAVSSPVIVNKSLIINITHGSQSSSKILAEEDTIKQIIFGDDSVTLVNDKNQKSAQFLASDSNVQKTIDTNQETPIQLSVEDGAESVPSNLNLNFEGKSADVNFDKSWSGVDIPKTFVTDFSGVTNKDGKVKLSTEMMNIPDINPIGIEEKSIQTSTHKQKLTKELAFWIFIGITGLVFIITLILCIVGLTCCKHVEQLDISSSAEANSDIAIGEVNGLPYTQAEIEERERNRPLIKEERNRLILERQKKREELERKKEEKKKKIQEMKEKRKKLIAEGKIEEEDFGDDDEEEEEFLEDRYFNDDDDMYHNRSQIFLAPSSTPQKKKQTKPQKKKYTETSEEFDQAKKKAQLNAASGAAVPPVAPPPAAPPKPAESDNDIEMSNSYNSQEHVSEFSASD